MNHLEPVRGVSHVGALAFYHHGQEVKLCFLLPTAAVIDGRNNLTIPAGPVLRRGRHRFAHVDVSMRLRLTEEAGLTLDALMVLSGIGAPQCHLTATHQSKSIQGYAAVVSQMSTAPSLPKIQEVIWARPREWGGCICRMNPRKQQLVHSLMEGALGLRRIHPPVKREINAYLLSR